MSFIFHGLSGEGGTSRASSQLASELAGEYFSQQRTSVFSGMMSVLAMGLLSAGYGHGYGLAACAGLLTALYTCRLYVNRLALRKGQSRSLLTLTHALYLFSSLVWAVSANKFLLLPDGPINLPFLMLVLGVMTLGPSIICAKPLTGLFHMLIIGVGINAGLSPDEQDYSTQGILMLTLLTSLSAGLCYHHYRGLKKNILLSLEKDSLFARLVEAKERAESTANAKTAFLATMSHEIRTPVNGLMGMLEILRETELSGSQRNYLNTASRSAESLLQLLNDILDFSKIEVGRLELEKVPFDWIAMVGEIALMNRVLAADKGIGFHLDIPPEGTSIVLGDPMRLRQIMNNLLSNALKFTHEGSVTLRAAIQSESAGKIMLSISVKDTGIGIEQEAQERLFQHYQQASAATTRNYGGTGLGLAISQQLAHLMGGNIRCNSEPGKGSEFILSVPFQKASADAMAGLANSRGARQDRFRAKILVVEDDPVSQRVAVLMLKSFGIIPTVVNTGKAAMEVEAGESFDLIFMDARLPDMNGFEAARMISARRKKRPSPEDGVQRPAIVAMTGADTPEDRRVAAECGVVDFLSKPVRKRDMRLCLEKWAGSGRALSPDA